LKLQKGGFRDETFHHFNGDAQPKKSHAYTPIIPILMFHGFAFNKVNNWLWMRNNPNNLKWMRSSARYMKAILEDPILCSTT